MESLRGRFKVKHRFTKKKKINKFLGVRKKTLFGIPVINVTEKKKAEVFE